MSKLIKTLALVAIGVAIRRVFKPKLIIGDHVVTTSSDRTIFKYLRNN
ncbi:hypothetical protein [Ruoffia tabacinasalis]|uniref:Uncharacterized protein n=1 Tax=Ruoffia tabacinasalis TaxID=87458 RepID=A0ABS0LIL3_9LACT|nr:hypothetical protein [Ruoffia tabacinasalis]MBG9977261.1 hypothetical protein [Ruoffia tabacinasalis]